MTSIQHKSHNHFVIEYLDKKFEVYQIKTVFKNLVHELWLLH